MRDNKLHTPVGVRDLLYDECAFKTEISERIREIFRCFGYQQVESPTFEYIEVFSDEKLGSTKPEQMYRFFDRDGSTLALRSDMTPPIARIAATSYYQTPYPLRFSYFGNAFKYNEDYQGKLREFAQAGVELLGVNSSDADAEIVAVAVNSLLAAGIENFKITIGDVEFFKGILEETGLQEEICQELQYCIGNRDYVRSEQIVRAYSMPENIQKLFIELPNLVGSLSILAYAKRLTKNRKAKQAISRLQDLFQLLRNYNIEEYVSFDLGMVNQLNYYTGIIFRGYTYESGYPIVAGGRYDHLVEQYGAGMPAVGFSLKISEIVSAAMKNSFTIPVKTPKTLVAYTEAGKATACQIANEYRKDGMYVENSLLGEDLEENMAYAKEKNMSHVLYFMDSVQVKVISLADEVGGFTVEVTVDELIRPGKEKAQ